MPKKLNVIGSRPARLDGVDKVTGQARFGPVWYMVKSFAVRMHMHES